MRGDPLDLSSNLFYLCCKNNGKSYVFSENTSNYSTSSYTPKAGFLKLGFYNIMINIMNLIL